MRELTQQERIGIVRYRLENAHSTLDEVASHIEKGYYNTAVNRMYYACYYTVSALLIIKHITTKSHDGVRQMFSLHYVKPGLVSVDNGRLYGQLFEKRTKGDYEDLFNNNLAICEELYPQARQFVEVMSNLVEEWIKEQGN